MLARAVLRSSAGLLGRTPTTTPMMTSSQAQFSSAAAPNAPVKGGAFTQEASERVLNVVRNFPKVVNKEKVALSSDFVTDLGLDSLDAVELVMAIEEEFAFDIADEEVEKIRTAQDAVQIVINSAEAK
eukprot:gnl/Hemi2/3845_TR1349_c0_g1_i1.p1 gnl/Hemi2/3845_TR1349_c0_g1~~gnl/Hemi2/3845_TR1349_c0_g1_i1.p1  ORF type:complete len:146 (+),score=55.58 gnl/Hemi2/3845_TR1349_c0_g1_i1:56-439(+)